MFGTEKLRCRDKLGRLGSSRLPALLQVEALERKEPEEDGFSTSSAVDEDTCEDGEGSTVLSCHTRRSPAAMAEWIASGRRITAPNRASPLAIMWE